MYLVTVSSIAHVNFDIILGIASEKSGIFELLWKYTELNLKCYDRSFEEENTYNEMNIYKISRENFKYLTKLHKVYSESFEDKFDKMGFNPEPSMTYFWYGVFESESSTEDFTRSECKKIKKIIKQSQKALE